MTERTDPSHAPRLVLASSSEWRRRALSEAGFTFETASPDIDEAAIFDELLARDCPAQIIAVEIAEAKLEALMPLYAGQDVLLIAGDQLAEFQDVPRGKPKDADQARAWMRGYRGSDVALVSALAVADARTGLVVHGTDTAVARYGDIPDEAIEQAILTGDVLRSCGAVVLEDPAIAPYAKIAKGTPDSVAGMPIELLRELLSLHLYRFSE